MTTLASRIARLAALPAGRPAVFGLVAVAAVYLAFIGTSASTASIFIKRGGYYVLLLVFVFWLAALWRVWRDPAKRDGIPRRELLVAILAVLGFSAVAISNETFRSKILYDEFVLQSTAFNMHFFRDITVMVRGYDVLGSFLSTDNYLDKRPYFYPFLISLVHDFTGYRSDNAYAVNTALLPLTLGIAYLLGRMVSGWRGGLLAVGLLGSLPLMAQNATGSGMELLNITMLLAAVGLGAAYLKQPDELRLSAFILTVVLLTQCRYESALYVLPAGMVVLAGWWQTRRITLSWAAVFTPLLLVPAALHNKVLTHNPVLWELRENQVSRFGFEHVPGNLRGAVEFLFSSLHQQSNSLWLSLLGTVSVGWIIARLVWRRPAPAALAPVHQVWLVFGLGIVANTVLVMFYFWASFMDPMASRFSLPLCVLLAFAAVSFAAWLDRRGPATPVLLFVTGIYFLGLFIPNQAQHRYSHLGIDEIEWERRFVAALDPAERLIVTNKSTLPWLLEQKPAILLERAQIVTDRLQHQLTEGPFHEILVIQTLKPTSPEGDFELVPEERLAGFDLQLLAEKRFGTRVDRISRLVAVNSSSVVE